MSECVFQVEFQLESRKLWEKGKSAPEAELLQCGEDELVDRIVARRLRRRAHSSRHSLCYHCLIKNYIHVHVVNCNTQWKLNIF